MLLLPDVGTRLRLHTESIPKSLIELEYGIPIIDYIMKVIGEVGISEVYIETGIENDIIVSMSDYVYEFSILKNLIRVSTRNRVLLCLDRSVRGGEP